MVELLLPERTRRLFTHGVQMKEQQHQLNGSARRE